MILILFLNFSITSTAVDRAVMLISGLGELKELREVYIRFE